FVPKSVNLVATNIHLPAGEEHLEAFLKKHPEDEPLRNTLREIFGNLRQSDELGSLLEIERVLAQALRRDRKRSPIFHQERQLQDRIRAVVERLRDHFGAEANERDLGAALFGEAASKGLSLVDLLVRRYDVVAA